MVKEYGIHLKVKIRKAVESDIHDSAVLNLKLGVGDRNESKYSDEEFINLIKEGNVFLSTLREDPIGYAVVVDGKVEEYYVEYGFKDTELEGFLKNISLVA